MAAPTGRARLGRGLQFVGLCLFPVALYYGIEKDDIYSELIIATMGIALLVMGRSMVAPSS